MDTISAFECAQAEIREDKPLRRTRIIIKVHTRHTRGQRVETCRQVLDQITHRQAGRHIAVQLVFNNACTAPNFLADVAFEHLVFVLAERATKHVFLHGAQHISVTHPAQKKINFIKVNSLKRNGGIGRFWQYISTARETRRGVTITNIKRQGCVFHQALPTRGRQSGTENHLIARAMLDTVDAELTTIRLHDKGLARQFHKGCIIDASLHQRFRKFRTDARCSGVLVNAVFSDPKSVFRYSLVERHNNVSTWLNALGETQGRDHIAPALQFFHRAGHDLQRTDFCTIIGRTKIRVVRSVQGALTHLTGIRTVLALHLHREARVLGPHITRI